MKITPQDRARYAVALLREAEITDRPEVARANRESAVLACLACAEDVAVSLGGYSADVFRAFRELREALEREGCS